MQLGSGTWDFHPAITYLAQTENYSYGAQLGGVIRTGENDQFSYGAIALRRLYGVLVKVTDSLSASVKLDYSSQNEVDGEDR